MADTKTRPFGPSGRKVSVIGQGTWNIEHTKHAEAVKLLQRGMDLGLTHIDTAEMYGSGLSEAIVGEAIAGRRAEAFVVSKVLPSNASRRGTIQACERSLRQLNTDYLDCYLLHWRGRYPLAETFEAFEELKASGRIRTWGVSNFDVDDLEEALQVAGPGVIACNQVLYHPQERAIEHGVLPWCERNGVPVVAYSPFGSGSFPRKGVLDEIAAAREVSARQVALAWVTRNPNVFTIPKSGSVSHTEDNAGALGLGLTDAETERINRAFPLGRPRSLPMI